MGRGKGIRREEGERGEMKTKGKGKREKRGRGIGMGGEEEGEGKRKDFGALKGAVLNAVSSS